MKKINGIIPTQCPTFPRSGHFVIHAVLVDYFGENLNWCDIHQTGDEGFEKNPNCNMEKHHDFELDLKINRQRNYLIGIRNPLDAIAGYQAMKVREGSGLEDWRPWRKEQLEYYRGFVQKWIYDPVPNRLVVRYERMVENPLYVFERIVEFMTGEKARTELLAEIVHNMKIKPQKKHPIPYAQI